MKTFLQLLLVLLTSGHLAAQMSPFDGSYTVLVKVQAKNLPADVRLELQEVEAPADSCRFSSKPLHIQFQVPEKVLIENRYNNKSWEYRAREYAKDASFMAPGYYAVVLHQGERTCMTPEGNDYRRKDRSFRIVAVQKDKTTVLATVPPEQVYNLSRMRGRWNEMMAIEVNYP
ncbi:MAG TPA: hypothetical protein PKE63_01095 [Lacibacter sp.]|nr:hypothetical protein [Lacibacter sp.]HMO90154.1 hypothetical protein [Lacibacter sp.]HMP85837.1 hypothetical protein [Lacibacter sp.]